MIEPQLRISSCAWSEEAARILESSTKWFPLATVEDYRLLLEQDADAKLLRVSQDGILAGFVIVKVEHFTAGSEGVIVAAAGRMKGADLVDLVLPALENLLAGVSSYRVTTARAGLKRKLERRGWTQTHSVLRKVAL